MAVGFMTKGSLAKRLATMPLGNLMVESRAFSGFTISRAFGFAVPSIFFGVASGTADAQRDNEQSVMLSFAIWRISFECMVSFLISRLYFYEHEVCNHAFFGEFY